LPDLAGLVLHGSLPLCRCCATCPILPCTASLVACHLSMTPAGTSTLCLRVSAVLASCSRVWATPSRIPTDEVDMEVSLPFIR
jgi:hypothetical protein